MNKAIMQQILDKIKEYDRIMLFRHVRNDGDCVGATKGLKAIIQLTWPEKEVYLIDKDTAAYLEFMGPEDPEVEDEVYASALGIVLDTASAARISNKKSTTTFPWKPTVILSGWKKNVPPAVRWWSSSMILSGMC